MSGPAEPTTKSSAALAAIGAAVLVTVGVLVYVGGTMLTSGGAETAAADRAQPSGDQAVGSTDSSDGSDGETSDQTVDGQKFSPDNNKGSGSDGKGDDQDYEGRPGDGSDGADGDEDPAGSAEGDQDGATTTSTTTRTTAPGTPDANDFCEASNRINDDIRFNRGATSSTVESVVLPDQVHLYNLEVSAGQILYLRADAADRDLIVGLLAPDGSVLPGRFTETSVFPTQAGIYRICVSTGQRRASYEMLVSVADDTSPVRIAAAWCGDSVNDRGQVRFANGETSTVIGQAVIRGERDLYEFDASAGQQLELFITSLEDNATLAFRGPDGEVYISEVSDFRMPLELSGTHQVCVGSTRGNASYTLVVSIN